MEEILQCERCGALLALGKETAHNGRFLCRACFLEVLAPSGVCDTAIQRGILTPRQNRILASLSDNDGFALDSLAAGLDLPLAALERELLTLARMEKVRTVSKDGKNIFLIY